MATTFKLIDSSTVGAGGTGSVVFNTIPQTYTHLYLIASARVSNTTTTGSVALRFNSDATANNYLYRRLYGVGTSAGSDNDATETRLLLGYSNGGGMTASVFGNVSALITDYTNSSRSKTVLSQGASPQNSSTQSLSLTAGRWTGTAAITSITLLPWDQPADFVQHSTFHLYGITNS